MRLALRAQVGVVDAEAEAAPTHSAVTHAANTGAAVFVTVKLVSEARTCCVPTTGDSIQRPTDPAQVSRRTLAQRRGLTPDTASLASFPLRRLDLPCKEHWERQHSSDCSKHPRGNGHGRENADCDYGDYVSDERFGLLTSSASLFRMASKRSACAPSCSAKQICAVGS